MNGSNETLCSTCEHINVCKHKDQYLAAQSQINMTYVSAGDKATIRIYDIPWIRNITLDCINYMRKLTHRGVDL